MMRYSLLAMGLLVSLSSAAQSPEWFNAAVPTNAQMERAKREGIKAADATSTLVNAGQDPVMVVQSAVSVYNTCDDLKSSVSAASALLPKQAPFVVQGVLALPGCPCGAESMWSQMRVDERLRVETRRESVVVGSGSSCLAATAAAAVEAAPEQADQILTAAIDTGRRGGSIVDSVGELGAPPPENMAVQLLKRNEAPAEGQEQPEQADACAADTDLADQFEVGKVFSERSADAEVVAPRTKPCQQTQDLLIDGVASARVSNTAVVIRNDSDNTIDLSRGGYVLEVYFAGQKDLGRVVPLNGALDPGASYVIASDEASDTVRRSANLVSSAVRVAPGDTVALRRAAYVRDCSAVPVALGSIANALGEREGSEWLDKTAEKYAAPDSEDLQAIDAIGQVGSSREAWQGTMAGQPLMLSREPSTCEADEQPNDAFNPSGKWTMMATPSSESLGGNAPRCAQRTTDLLITQYVNDADQYRAVEITNNSAGSIDLAERGYMLEVYGEGAVDPTNTIALEGNLTPGQTLVVADDEAPDNVREKANVVTAELGVPKIAALVLRRANVGTNRACSTEVIALARDLGPVPVMLTFRGMLTPVREPRTDDGARGGDVASPN